MLMNKKLTVHKYLPNGEVEGGGVKVFEITAWGWVAQQGATGRGLQRKPAPADY